MIRREACAGQRSCARLSGPNKSGQSRSEAKSGTNKERPFALSPPCLPLFSPSRPLKRRKIANGQGFQKNCERWKLKLQKKKRAGTFCWFRLAFGATRRS